MDGDLCLADSGTTHTLTDKKYFSNLKLKDSVENVCTISVNAKMIKGYGRAKLSMLKGTKFEISDALDSSDLYTNLLSFKDIRRNGYHIESIINVALNIFALRRSRNIHGKSYQLCHLD